MCGLGEWGWGIVVSEFFRQRIQFYLFIFLYFFIFFFWGGGGWGGGAVFFYKLSRGAGVKGGGRVSVYA